MMNTEKHIRLAALDLDGTTLRSDKSLSEYTIETLKNAHEHGMHIVVASGRSFASLPEQVIQFPWWKALWTEFPIQPVPMCKILFYSEPASILYPT